ncbi:MAG: gliding motility-associated C-terminal domain-containing protein, partial [Crocinitomicaceae bacterium]|nr:gliding motility-associated C-terminal domain-containing protein [Crocinitomicaceae bacterium]
FGQLTTSTAQSPSALVQNVLLGSGVTVSNISFNGVPVTIGSFDASNTNLGIDQGIIMTTGTVQNIPGEGPHGPNNSGGAGRDNSAPGYPLLSSLINNIATYDAAILEFDFIPYSDSVKFNYVFGSEEYPEYVNSTYNDAFAFFISGPNIPGGIQNIAQVPFGGGPVTINNVNNGQTNTGPCQNCAYYNNNGDGSSAPQNSSANYIQYDGFTDVMTAASKVECGETYHLIICIADAGDGLLDSGIFLEANSLSSKTPIDIEYEVSQELFGSPDIIGEGCVTTTVTLERDPAQSASAMTIPINILGTATEGVDYTNLPNSITFPAGVSQVQFSFDAFQDALVEGQETIIIEFPIVDPCGNVTPIVIELFIQDIDPVAVDITGGTIACPGESTTLTANPSGGAPPYTYLWSTGETTQTISITPGATTIYTVTVTDACLIESASNDIEITVPIIPPLVLNQTPDITEICPYLPALLEANAVGGSGNYTYQWSSSFDPNLGTASSINVAPSTTTTYTVIVTDNCGNTTTGTILYTVTSPPLILTMSPNLEICPFDSVYISVVPTGGYGQYYYYWTHTGETTDGVWVTPGSTTTYDVIVSDECQTFTVDGSMTVTVVAPTADFTTSSTTFFNNFPITFVNQSQNAVDYEWTFGDGNTDTFIHPTNTYDEPGLYYITLIAIDDKGCTDTIVKPINIEEEWFIYIPNTFTPDGDRNNNDFRVSTIGIRSLDVGIYNRWGELIFTSPDLNFIWDGTYHGLYVPDGTYTYNIVFVTNSGRDKNLRGHVNVLK